MLSLTSLVECYPGSDKGIGKLNVSFQSSIMGNLGSSDWIMHSIFSDSEYYKEDFRF